MHHTKDSESETCEMHTDVQQPQVFNFRKVCTVNLNIIC